MAISNDALRFDFGRPVSRAKWSSFDKMESIYDRAPLAGPYKPKPGCRAMLESVVDVESRVLRQACHYNL